MKLYLSTLLLLSFTLLSNASELGLKKVFLPLYIANAYAGGEGDDVHSTPTSISFVSRGAEPETTLEVLKSSFVPHHDTTWHEKPKDTNLISLCGVKLSYAYIKRQPEELVNILEIHLDMKAFKKPKTVHMENDKVIALIKKSISLNMPGAVIKILNKE